MRARRRVLRAGRKKKRGGTWRWGVGGAVGFIVVAELANSAQADGELIYALLPLVLMLILAVIAWYLWQSWRASRRDAGTLAQLLRLSPREFEERIARLFLAMGYVGPQVTGRADDRGADIICDDEWGRRVVIQCKRYAPNRKVGSEAVQAVAGMYRNWHHADHAIIVTTASFTRSAIETARSAHLSLIDGERLVRLIEKVEAATAAQPRSLLGPAQPAHARPLSEWLGEDRQAR